MGKLTLAWGDGEHDFLLPIGQLRELQDKTDAGPQEVFTRLSTGRWRVDDVREPIRLGLIGGGMKPSDAMVLTKRYVDDRPLLENLKVAQAILMISLVGDEPDEGKVEARKAKSDPSERSPSGQSTDGARPSGSAPAK